MSLTSQYGIPEIVTLEEFKSETGVFENVNWPDGDDGTQARNRRERSVVSYINIMSQRIDALTNGRLFTGWQKLLDEYEAATDPTIKMKLGQEIYAVKFAIIQAVDYAIQLAGVWADTRLELPSNVSFSVEGTSDNADIEAKRKDIINLLNKTRFYDRVQTFSTSQNDVDWNDFWDTLQEEQPEFTEKQIIWLQEHFYPATNYGGKILLTQDLDMSRENNTLPWDIANGGNIVGAVLPSGGYPEIKNYTLNSRYNNIIGFATPEELNRLQNQINQNTTDISTNKNSITTLDNDLGSLGNQVGTIQGDVNSLKLVQKQQSKDIITLENEVDILKEFANNGYVIKFMGVWDPNTLYEIGQYVLYNNLTYFCIKENRAIEPTNTEYWYQKTVSQEINLSNYYTKQEIDTKLQNYAELNEDNEFIGDNTFSGTNTFNNAAVNTISVNNALACSGNAQFTGRAIFSGETNFNNNGVVINNDFMNVDVPTVFSNSTNFAQVPTYSGNPLVYSSQLNAYALKSNVRNVRQFAVAPSSFRYVNGFNNGNTRTKIYTYQVSSSIRSTLINITWQRSSGMWLTMNYEIDVNGYIQFYFNRPDTSNDFGIDGVFYIYYY